MFHVERMLKDGACELGVVLGGNQADAFALYLAELQKWAARISLTTITDPQEVVIKHFLDSLALCPFLPEGPFRAADIGAGAGFPGLAVKLVRPDMDITLIEPVNKKASFLKQVVRVLGITGVTVLAERLGPDPGELTGRFDVVFSRAFKGPEELLPLAGPLLAKGGRVVLSLGPGSEPAPPAGWSILNKKDLTLPFSGYKRTLVSYRKI
jgi:16S rRNA (guanine527-N7)-methyltransferase